MRIRRWQIVTVLLVLAAMTAIYAIYRAVTFTMVQKESIARTVVFSPNSEWIAYANCTEVRKLWLQLAAQSVSVRWSRVDNPSMYKERLIESGGADMASLNKHVHVAFSPDSRLLAIATVSRITVIDLNNDVSYVHDLSDVSLTGFKWINNGEFVYSGYQGGQYYFWQKKALQPKDKRQVIFTIGGWVELFGVDGENWSPTGRYVVFRDNHGIRLLDCVTWGWQFIVADSKVSMYGAPAWKRDETKVVVFCDPMRVLLYDTVEHSTNDITGKLNHTISPGGNGGSVALFFGTDRSWTADDKYFVIHWLDSKVQQGPYLVDPEHWEAKFVPGVDVVSPFLTPGWVKGWNVVNGELGDQCFAISYDGKQKILLNDGYQSSDHAPRYDHAHDPRYDPAPRCSPDMTKAAVVQDGKVIVYDLPRLTTATSEPSK